LLSFHLRLIYLIPLSSTIANWFDIGTVEIEIASMEMSRGSNSFDNKKPSCQRGHWRPVEDDNLRQLVEQYGPKNWNFIAQHLYGRSGNQYIYIDISLYICI